MNKMETLYAINKAASDTTDEEIYIEVREAITSDRQYAAESIMHWQSKGEDLKHIATMLETDVDVLVDLIEEFTEAGT